MIAQKGKFWLKYAKGTYVETDMIPWYKTLPLVRKIRANKIRKRVKQDFEMWEGSWELGYFKHELNSSLLIADAIERGDEIEAMAKQRRLEYAYRIRGYDNADGLYNI